MGFPKALLDYRGRSFLQSILDAIEALGLRGLVALGHDADKILSQHDLRGVTVVMNDTLEDGPIGSIRASIKAVEDAPVDGLLVWPVDFPHVGLDTVRALVDRFGEKDHPAIVVPEFEGRSGHPVIFGREVFNELLDVVSSNGARAVVRRDRSRVARIGVNDAAIVDCVNTPESYAELLRRADRQHS